MPRLFVAAMLPEEVKDILLPIRPAFSAGLRLTERDDIHLTLHFIGEIDEEQTRAVRGALARVRAEPFAITLRGVGRFPPEGEAEVVWAGVQPHPALSALHHSVAAALSTAIGFTLKDRPYIPHITLAYLDPGVPPGFVEDYLHKHAAFEVAVVPIVRFALHASVLPPIGPRYPVEEAFALTIT
jgi:2'-5' RNA ligase